MAEPPKRLSPEQCREKAAECKDMARLSKNEAHRIMLLHMSDTWARIGATLPSNGDDQ
jgi:hypothetical protein